ncbi:unnamed protein product [Didymodactylos carnosus]|uniref:Pentatricopeptide repeat-containing protein n=1 Tax=Didymodactylos carnosus TaxID=1234261 RepID=A0A813XWN8_9BILA|nr:unnamed protein product [Didymodactylos carnosus]CAF1141239.1 unnamed protein product [Didymodactylos carnosus]CAF3661220.1 unnamed protein product [Didymodactylos carnosus]CAF3936942.1 unnamed protein product [Didymodactylos carnosus]
MLRYLIHHALSSNPSLFIRSVINVPYRKPVSNDSDVIIDYATKMKELNKQEDSGKILKLFDEITKTKQLLPNSFICLLALQACIRTKNFSKGKEIHSIIKQNPHIDLSQTADLRLKNTLISFYAKCGTSEEIVEAEQLFYEIPGGQRDTITYNTMMKGYNIHRMFEKSLKLFDHMQQMDKDDTSYKMAMNAYSKLGYEKQAKELKKDFEKLYGYKFEHDSNRDLVFNTSLIDTYGRNGQIENAIRLFLSMPKKNVYTYGSMMKCYIQNEMAKEALDLYDELLLDKKNQVQPNYVIYILAFTACGKIGNSCLDKGSQVHADLLKQPHLITAESYVKLYAALIDMYGKCGNVENARKIFDEVPRDQQTTILWNSLLTSYAVNGLGQDVLELYKTMLDHQCKPDSRTSPIVMNSCNNSGLLNEAKHVFEQIHTDKR